MEGVDELMNKLPPHGSYVCHGCEALMKKGYYVEIQAEGSCVF